MKFLSSRVFWGVLLLLGGVALLLENLNILRIGGLIWGIILGVGGLIFLSVYLENRAAWWALIPGVTLLAICVSSLINYLIPSVSEYLSGVIVLGGIGLSFFLVYLVNRENWWAIIPAGVLVTLGIISVVEADNFNVETGGYFFIGIGLTFFLLAILPAPHGQMKWAFIPAVILLVMGVLITAAEQEIMVYVWPVLVIIVGGYIIYKALRSSRSGT